MGLIQTIGPGPTALDTAVFIYFIEGHPDFLPLVRPIFEEADSGKRRIITSALTLLKSWLSPAAPVTTLWRNTMKPCSPEAGE